MFQRKEIKLNLPVINLLRPGAIGDVFISSTIIKGLKKKYPGSLINYYTWFLEAGNLIADVDNVYNSEDWDKREKGIDYILNPYPYPKSMTKHLIEYYADCCGISVDYNYSLKQINYTLSHGKFITLHVKTGWSIYKEWSFDKWNELVKELRPLIGQIKIIQIGSKDDPLIEGIDIDYRGKTTIEETCVLVRDAELHLGVDTFTNHIAGAYKKPAVILFGSTHSLGFGYSTAKNIYKDLACQPCFKENPSMSKVPKGTCSHKSCMNSITVEEVLQAACEQLKIERKPKLNKDKPICLGMIVKNEALNIKKTLESVKSILDYWVISDTGSTDNTIEIIKETLKDIPGELIQSKFVDFGTNRSEVARIAKDKADYTLMLDADFLITLDNFDKSSLIADQYDVKIKWLDTIFYNSFLLSNRLDWKSVGVVHEYWSAEGIQTRAKAVGISIDHDRHGNPRPKGLHDLALLLQGVKDEPNNARYYFYLANTYRDVGEYQKAIDTFYTRIKMGGWIEEVFYSLYQIGYCYELMNEVTKAKVAYLRAWEFRPSRAEPLYKLAKLCRTYKEYHQSYLFASKGLEIPISSDTIFVDSATYNYGLRFEKSIAAYWLGKYEESIEDCNIIDNSSNVPEDVKVQNLKNKSFAEYKLNGSI
jgi:ADP-heptose:LPS heptosyltransferase/glycosyltransferase involved in cell wall biosynthesis